MLPDRVSNPGPLTYESGALPIALRGPAQLSSESRLYYIELLFILNLMIVILCNMYKEIKFKLSLCYMYMYASVTSSICSCCNIIQYLHPRFLSENETKFTLTSLSCTVWYCTSVPPCHQNHKKAYNNFGKDAFSKLKISGKLIRLNMNSTQKEVTSQTD